MLVDEGILFYHTCMIDILVAELLLLGLQFPVVCRAFVSGYFRKSKRDTLSVLPVLVFPGSIVLLLCFSCRATVLAVMCVSCVIFLTNLPRFVLMCSDLTRDYFSVFYKVISVLECIMLAALCVFICAFRPDAASIPASRPADAYRQESADSGTPALERKSVLLYGSCSRGFEKRSGMFSPYNAQCTLIYPCVSGTAPDAKLPVVVFVPDAGTSAADCMLQLEKIAAAGNCVVAADIYAPDAAYPGSGKASAVFRAFQIRMISVSASGVSAALQRDIKRCKALELAAAAAAVPVLADDLPAAADTASVYIAGGGTVAGVLKPVSVLHSADIAGIYEPAVSDEWYTRTAAGFWAGDLAALDPAEYAVWNFLRNILKK